MLGEIFLFFLAQKEILMIISNNKCNTKEVKINKPKSRVIYRPRFKSSNSIVDGPQMTWQLG